MTYKCYVRSNVFRFTEHCTPCCLCRPTSVREPRKDYVIHVLEQMKVLISYSKLTVIKSSVNPPFEQL